jgi:hypothetical protein
LEIEYLARYSVDFRADLKHPDFKARYDQLAGELFRRNFFDKIRNWCDEHKLLFTGHLLEEHNIKEAHIASGDPLKATIGLSMPGVDEIFTRIGVDDFEWVTFAAGHWGIKQRGNGGLAELFALGPADMPPSRLNAMFHMAGMFGVNHYVLAVSALDFRGNVPKPGYFFPATLDQPYFADLKILSEDAGEAAVLASKNSAPELGVRYLESCSCKLNELLKTLVKGQYPWHLLASDESPTDEIEVITLTENGIHLEYADCYFAMPGDLLVNLPQLLPRKVWVTDAQDQIVQNIFLKQYADGSTAILDLSDRPGCRCLKLHRNNEEAVFELHGREFCSFPGWKVERESANTLRVAFDRYGKFEFHADVPLELDFAIRTFEGVRIALDDREIAGNSAVKWLSDGFRPLYRSFRQTIPAGKHQITLLEGKDVYPYLPALWLGGEFGCKNGHLFEDRCNGNGISEYAGAINQSGTVKIPANAIGISLECDGLDTELLINGESLGKRLYEPFFWNIPEEFRGKSVEVRIRRLTSIGPMFGNVTRFKNTFKSHYTEQYPIVHRVMELHYHLI